MIVTNRHYVLKTNIKPPFSKEHETIVLGNGCFWGSERSFWTLKGIHTTAVGYIGGDLKHPTYRQVCSGQTGHNECVLVVFDPKQISVVDVLARFWESHDPTQGNGQGNDRGTQYRSGIYCTTKEQQEIANASKKAYEKALRDAGKGLGPRKDKEGGPYPITTEIVYPAPPFYYAEDYHQQYLVKPGSRQYCSAMPQGVKLPPAASWLPERFRGDDKFAEKTVPAAAPCGS